MSTHDISLETLNLHRFAAHMANHNSKYSRGDIYAVLEGAVHCMSELVKQGYKVSLGDLGAFYPSISCEGADSIADFSTDNIRALSMNWDRPAALDNMKEGASFYRVPTRAVLSASLKAENDGKADEVIERYDNRGEGDSALTPGDGTAPDSPSGPDNGTEDNGGGSAVGDDGSDDDDQNA